MDGILPFQRSGNENFLGSLQTFENQEGERPERGDPPRPRSHRVPEGVEVELEAPKALPARVLRPTALSEVKGDFG